MGVHTSVIRPTEDIFNANDPRLKDDILAIIMQYLSDEGYTAAQSVLYDEANVKWKEREERTMEVKRLKKAILGKWALIEKRADSLTWVVYRWRLAGSWETVCKASGQEPSVVFILGLQATVPRIYR